MTESPTYYCSQGEDVNDGGVRLITVAKERTSMTEKSDLLLEPRRSPTYYCSQGEGVNDGGVRLITVAKERTSMTEELITVRLITVAKERTSMTEESDLLLEPRRGRQ